MRRLLAALVATAIVVPFALMGPRPASAAGDRVFVITDSVVLGAVPAIRSAFAGWQVDVVGRQGLFANDAAELAWASRAAIGDEVVVAVGYNYPVWNPPLFDAWIDQMLGRLTAAGATRVHWVTLRSPVAGVDGIVSVWEQTGIALRYPEANAQLRAAMARWPQLSLADWATVGAGPGLTWDGIHLNPTGAAKMAALLYDEVAGRGRVAEGTSLRVPLTGLPADAVAAAVNVTATGARSAGYVTLHGCDEPVPLASNLNIAPGRTTANLAVVPVRDGAVCVYASTAVHVVVDLTGAVGPGAALTTGAPQRVLDTRTAPGARVAARATTTVPLPVPAGTTAAVLNVTVTEPGVAGYATAYACGEPAPLASNLNVAAGETRAALVLAPLAADGSVCLTTSMATHLVVDLQGWFLPSGTYRAATPTRLLDTRTGGAARVAAGATVAVELPAGLSAAAVTVTADQPSSAGFVTLHACDAPRPLASALNPVAGQAVANAALTAGGRLCVYTSQPTHLLVDVSGGFAATDGFAPLGPLRLWDTRTAPAPAPPTAAAALSAWP